jgi:sulfatase modifying factor 1
MRIILCWLTICLFFLSSGVSLLNAKPRKAIRTSPVIISWDAGAKAFNADYMVYNDSDEDRELSAIITFQSEKVRWWRGAVLPVVKAHTSERFAVAFPAYILLKNDYKEISVKLYGSKDYKPFLDKSSHYQDLSSKVVTDENLSVKFGGSIKDPAAGDARQPESLVLGEKRVLRSLLMSSLGEGAKLKRVSEEDGQRKEEVLVEMEAKKAETEDLLAEIDAMEDEPLEELEENPEELSDSDFEELKTEGLGELDAESDAESLFSLGAEEKAAAATPMSGKAGLMETFLKQKMQTNPEDIASRNKLVRLYVEEKDPNRAIALLKTTLQAQPDDLDASLTLSKVYKNVGKVVNAVKLLAFTLGRMAVSARNAISQEIRQAIKAGKSTNTKLSDAAYLAIEYEKWGLGFLKHGLYDKALFTFEKIRDIIPDYPMINYHIGLSLKGQQKHPEAVAAFWKQDSTVGTHENALKNLLAMAGSIAETKDTDSAKKAIEKLENIKAAEQRPDKQREISQHIGELKNMLGGDAPAEMVLIPAGEFQMGNGKEFQFFYRHEMPAHTVFLDAYYIDKTEVTAAAFKKCVDAGKCKKPYVDDGYSYDVAGKENFPINGVDWTHADDYCRFVNKRLPTEAEWEKAAAWRDGKKYWFPSGKETTTCADAVMYTGEDGCDGYYPEAVATRNPEINGTYDMAGNLMEWTANWWYSYSEEPQNNPRGPEEGDERAIRSAAYNYKESFMRATWRSAWDPTAYDVNVGFRCARSAK